MTSVWFWLSFGAVFGALFSVSRAALSLRPIRIRRVTVGRGEVRAFPVAALEADHAPRPTFDRAA